MIPEYDQHPRTPEPKDYLELSRKQLREEHKKEIARWRTTTSHNQTERRN